MLSKRLSIVLLSIFLPGTWSLSACQPTSGSLQFQVQLPAQSHTAFRLKALPEQTNRLQLEISGQGLSTPYTETFTTQTPGKQITRHLALPAGNKSIRVRAFEDEKLLAQGQGSVSIQTGKKSQLTLTLSPVDTPSENSLQITLAGIVPTRVPMRLRISGAGLPQALERTLVLPAGVSPTVTLDASLPPGEKRLEIHIETIDGLSKPLPTITENFIVNEKGGAELELSLEALIARYRVELSQIPELLELLRRYAPHLLFMIETPAEPSPSPTATPGSGNQGNGQIRLGEVIPSKDHAP